MSDDITLLSVKDLMDSGEDYAIPIYQRNYAWDEGEITQLIQDIIDSLPNNGAAAQNYYIGTLVVFERKESKPTMFETIDGQQRLTTLSLLASYLKNIKDKTADLSWYQALRIHFDSRERSQKTFSAIFKGNFENDPSEVLGEKEINSAILNGYRLIAKILLQKLKESQRTVGEFTDYLFGRVQIMRVKVPDDTDLNHYFEIMNSRGEQLEKHEVLKSKLMAVLESEITDKDESQQSMNCLHAVWEACSNMERYVQMGFPPAQRSAIFGDKDWGRFDLTDFDALREALTNAEEDGLAQPGSAGSIVLSLEEIISTAQGGGEKNKKNDEASERFNTVINFSNFLLQVLRVETERDIPLDDKRLISIFESEVLRQPNVVTHVKRFIFALLRCKYLFDQFVIKREFIGEKDRWSLQSLKWNGDKPNYVNSFGDEDKTVLNRRILMLLSAFHVSTPTMVYKHWLNAALYFLFHCKGKIQAQDYLNYLESLATAFVFDRFVAPESSAKGYFEMIYTNKGVCQTKPGSVSDEDLNNGLKFGNIQNNLIFNFLDYLLWLEHGTSEPIKSFSFSFRSSVEHYYPQHPLPGIDRLDPNDLNSFGNLCLISQSKNSKLSNFMPQAKKEHYKVGSLDSVKQYLMMKIESWNASAIFKHSIEMYGVLQESLARGAQNDDTQKE